MMMEIMVEEMMEMYGKKTKEERKEVLVYSLGRRNNMSKNNGLILC
jgi:hypothetical protein